jgi:hypothetical protein
VFATAVAWPTILLPVEYALISQFLAFNALYFLDSRAARNGWAPEWYPSYRFFLTFIVGASIVVSLIGQGEVFDKHGALPGPTEKLQALKDQDWESLEKAERERLAKIAEEEDSEDSDEEEEEEE